MISTEQLSSAPQKLDQLAETIYQRNMTTYTKARSPGQFNLLAGRFHTTAIGTPGDGPIVKKRDGQQQTSS